MSCFQNDAVVNAPDTVVRQKAVQSDEKQPATKKSCWKLLRRRLRLRKNEKQENVLPAAESLEAEFQEEVVESQNKQLTYLEEKDNEKDSSEDNCFSATDDKQGEGDEMLLKKRSNHETETFHFECSAECSPDNELQKDVGSQENQLTALDVRDCEKLGSEESSEDICFSALSSLPDDPPGEGDGKLPTKDSSQGMKIIPVELPLTNSVDTELREENVESRERQLIAVDERDNKKTGDEESSEDIWWSTLSSQADDPPGEGDKTLPRKELQIIPVELPDANSTDTEPQEEDVESQENQLPALDERDNEKLSNEESSENIGCCSTLYSQPGDLPGEGGETLPKKESGQEIEVIPVELPDANSVDNELQKEHAESQEKQPTVLDERDNKKNGDDESSEDIWWSTLSSLADDPHGEGDMTLPRKESNQEMQIVPVELPNANSVDTEESQYKQLKALDERDNGKLVDEENSEDIWWSTLSSSLPDDPPGEGDETLPRRREMRR